MSYGLVFFWPKFYSLGTSTGLGRDRDGDGTGMGRGWDGNKTGTKYKSEVLRNIAPKVV